MSFFIRNLLLILLIIIPSSTIYAKSISKKNKKYSTVVIKSDIIDIKKKDQNIEFIDNVIIEKDDSSLLANKMILFYEKNKANNKNSANEEDLIESNEQTQDNQANNQTSSSQNKASIIKKIEAYDKVKLFSDNYSASSDYGFFDPKNNSFILEKNVIVNNGSSTASGEKFIFNLKTKKGNLIGSKDTSNDVIKKDKRVIVVIDEELEQKKSKNKNESKK